MSQSAAAGIVPGEAGESPGCSLWVPWRGTQVYQGAGGTTRMIDGVEFWATGRPERKHTQVGYMIFFLPTRPGYTACADKPRDSDAARVAREVQGDAVVPLGLVGGNREFRVIKYLPADSADSTAVTDEHVAPDFDNFTATRETGPGIVVKPTGIEKAPNVEDYYPAEARQARQEGTTQIRACSGVDGRIDRPVEIVTSSGNPTLDSAAARWGAAVTYTPETVNGKPTPSCKEMRVSFQMR
ncbi:MAG: TonB family protein [Proteobacteria bacterium]|nr:TonB family protein [Pseudomonadota bacterium]